MKFLTHLILIGQIEICDLVESKILPLIQNVCLVDKYFTFSSRGATIFKNSVSPMTFENFGLEYHRRCLESVMVWAIWLPVKFGNELQPSLYAKAYRNLRSEGVTFPAESQLKYFRHDYLERCEARIREI